MRRTAREKELRGLSIVPLAIGEPITSEVLQRIRTLAEKRKRSQREKTRLGLNRESRVVHAIGRSEGAVAGCCIKAMRLGSPLLLLHWEKAGDSSTTLAGEQPRHELIGLRISLLVSASFSRCSTDPVGSSRLADCSETPVKKNLGMIHITRSRSFNCQSCSLYVGDIRCRKPFFSDICRKGPG